MLTLLVWQGEVEQALAHLYQLRPTEERDPIKPLEEAISYLEHQLVEPDIPKTLTKLDDAARLEPCRTNVRYLQRKQPKNWEPG